MLPSTSYEVTDSFGRTRLADSKSEYFFSLALHSYKIRFWFQYTVQGGHTLKGGVVVDFMTYVPFRQPVEIIGAYWHQETNEERFRNSIVESAFGTPIIEVPEDECDDLDKAKSAVRRYLRY